MPEIPGLRVFRSPIHGFGAKATKEFSPGDLIADVDGILFHAEEIPDDTYALYVEDDWLFDMMDQTRWINHSCEPNAEILAELDGKGGAWAKIVAIRPIQVGDEIAYDYGFPADVAEPCRCKAASCRKYIVDEDELPRLKRRLARKAH